MTTKEIAKKIKKVIDLKGLVSDSIYREAIEKTLETARSCNMQDAASDLVKILNKI